jgi:hypothetical protein
MQRTHTGLKWPPPSTLTVIKPQKMASNIERFRERFLRRKQGTSELDHYDMNYVVMRNRPWPQSLKNFDEILIDNHRRQSGGDDLMREEKRTEGAA